MTFWSACKYVLSGAAKRGRQDIINHLLEAGVDINPWPSKGETALEKPIACRKQ